MKNKSQRLILFLAMILIIPSITCTILQPKPDANQEQPGVEVSDEMSSDHPGNALPAASGDEIEIAQTTTYLDEFGHWNIHGLLTNVSEYPVGGLELEILAAGVAVTDPVLAGAFGIAPDEIQPFSIRLPLSVTSVEDLEVNILQIRRVELDPANLDLGQTRIGTAENGIVILTGEILNNSNGPALIQSTKAAFFTADGKLITTGSCQVCPGYIIPGDKAPFQFMIYGQSTNEVIDYYEIYTSAEMAATVEGLDFDFAEPIHTYLDPAGSFHILGFVQNNSEKIIALQLLGTFYDQNGEIVGASSNSLPVKSLAPGESAPYDLVLAGPIDPVADWGIQVNLARTFERDVPAFHLPATITGITKEQFISTLSGNAINDSGQTLRLITVVVGLRDAGTGELVGLSHHLEAGEFPAGAAIDFNLSVSPDPDIDPAALEEFIMVLGE